MSVGIQNAPPHIYPKGETAEPPLQQKMHRHMCFSETSPPVVDANGDEEEDEHFPTAPLDDSVWSEEPIPERELCIQIA